VHLSCIRSFVRSFHSFCFCLFVGEASYFCVMVFAMLMEFKFRPVLGSSLLLGSTSGSEKNLVICVLRAQCIVTFCNLICIVVVFFLMSFFLHFFSCFLFCIVISCGLWHRFYLCSCLVVLSILLFNVFPRPLD